MSTQNVPPRARLEPERVGLAFAALCALNGAFVPAVAKLSTASTDPFVIAALTSACGGVCAAAVLAWRGELGILVQPVIGPRLATIGLLGTAIAYTLFFVGTSRSTAIETVLCLQIEPAYALLLSWLALGHRPTLRRVIATALLLAGIYLSIAGGDSGTFGSGGALFLLATPLTWQLSHLITLRGLVGVAPHVLTGARYIYGGLILLIVLFGVHGTAAIPPLAASGNLWPLIGLQGVVLYYGGTLLWYNTVLRLDLTRSTAIVVPSIPVLSLAATFLLVGEVPSQRELLGMGLTIGGVLAFVTAPAIATTKVRVPTATAPIAIPTDRET